MKKGLIIGGVIAALALAYVAATPYIAIHDMKTAIVARDGNALAEFIDFPSVRQSAKDQFNAAALERFAASDDNSGLEAVGAALATTMIDKMIDVAVTPAGLTKLMDKAEKKGVLGSSRLANATSSYESWDKFVVTTDGKAKDQGKFILRRQGLTGWKLTEFILPESIFQEDPPSTPDATAAEVVDQDLEMGMLAPPEVPAVSSTTPANFTPLLSPNGVITQGRCHMGECGWAKWLTASKVSETPDETVITYSLLGGTSTHAEVEDYPSTPDGTAIEWDTEPHAVKVRCSHTRPSVAYDGAAEDVLGLNPETGVFGYQESSAAVYFMACHTDRSAQGYTGSIEKYGYNVKT